MSKKTVHLLIHITGCIVFLSLPILFSPDFTNPFTLYKIPPFQRDFIGYIILILFFYLNYYVLIPRLYFSKQYFWFGIITIACYLFVSLAPNLFISFNEFQHPQEMNAVCTFPAFNKGPLHRSTYFNRPYFRLFNQHFFEFFIVFVLSLMLKISNRLKLTKRKDKR